MFIYAGKRTRHRRLGRVADFCPLCDEIRPCRVTQIESVTHLYFIPLSRGEVKGHTIRCERCRCPITANIGAYLGFVRSRRAGLEELIEQTNPGVEERLIRRLELEERAASADLSPGERFELLHAPFLSIAAAVEQRAAAVHVDRRSAMFLLALLGAGSILLGPVMLRTGPTLSKVIYWTGGIFAAVAFVALLWSLATDSRRFARNRFRHIIVQSLADLDPTRQELDMVFKGLRSKGMLVGRKLSPEAVLAMLGQFSAESELSVLGEQGQMPTGT